MKKFFYLLTAIAGWHLIEAMTEKDAIGGLEAFGEKCDPVPNQEDYKAIVRNTKEVKKSTKCFRLCLMNQLEMLQDNCKLDAEKLTDLIAMMQDGKEQETAEIANKCNAQVKCGEPCDTAHDQAMCILNEFAARKWPMPELEKD